MTAITRIACTIVLSSVLAGCNGTIPTRSELPLPDIKAASQLPQFTKEENEVQIADSFNDVDPSWVLGSLVDLKTGKVRGLDNYLKQEAKAKVTPQSEVAFKDFIENSVAVNAAWLSFLSARVSDSVRAEVTVAKTAKVTIDSGNIDKAALLKELKSIPADRRADHGIIIGYVDFVLTASLFKNTGAEGGATGYGAKIGGNWFSKSENTSAHHRIVAIWSPLPFVLDVVESGAKKDLAKATAEAISARAIAIDTKALQGIQSLIRY